MDRYLPISRIAESESNPRKTFGDLEELAGSIRAHGVLQPLVVRERPEGGWEVICGARRLRAAHLAGLKSVPVREIEADDATVLELQLTENSQRKDVDPFDESAAIAALVQRHHRSAEDVADRLGRSPRWVRQRVSLAEAPDQLVEWCRAGMIPLGGVYALMACSERIREAVRDRLAKWIEGGLGQPRSLRDVRGQIQACSRLLEQAPWALDDGTLPGPEGGCACCPLRTGHQVDLFGAADDDDRCLDPECWDGRERAWAGRLRAKVEAAGGEVIELERSYDRADAERLGEDAEHDLVEALGVKVDDDELLTIGELLERAGADLPVSLVIRPPFSGRGPARYERVVTHAALAALLEERGAAELAAELRPLTEEEEAEADARRARAAEESRERWAENVRAAAQERRKRWSEATRRERLLALACLVLDERWRWNGEAREALTERYGVDWLDSGESIAGLDEQTLWWLIYDARPSVAEFAPRREDPELCAHPPAQPEGMASTPPAPRPPAGADVAEEEGDVYEVPTCRVCGCTDYLGCEGGGGCEWVIDVEEGGDLCSACVCEECGAVEECGLGEGFRRLCARCLGDEAGPVGDEEVEEVDPVEVAERDVRELLERPPLKSWRLRSLAEEAGRDECHVRLALDRLIGAGQAEARRGWYAATGAS